jgi:dipeptidyl-peptidase-4
MAANEALKAKVEALQRKRVEYFKLDLGEGVQVDGWRILPPDFDPAGKYPLLVYVYGEPAGQTVQDNWGGSGYLWHLMLAQQGYVVVSFDNRGTPAAWPFIDAERVGVWGWSGGGSMTLNLMFRSPDLYHTGMSVAPVPDQLLYDTIYQERYMGLPDENRENYRLGSPITFADQLAGNLLVVHGTGDDNVHYQGAERLANALIKANKPFTFMPYPNRSHAISEGPGTSRHLYELLTRYLREHIRPGPSQ